MEMQRLAVSPFGRQPISLALWQAHKSYQKITDASVDKWALHRDLCVAKSILGTNNRALTVLSALLSFYPNNELSEKYGLVVFPSNKQLSLRAHGMPDSTLRRHLSSLVKSGLIMRRDSPNGKRYAHKNRAGDIDEAFGFSLAPLLGRAREISQAAEQVRIEATLLRRTRERITLQRRDISKLFEVLMEEDLSSDLSAIWTRFRTLVDTLPRKASLRELDSILIAFNDIRSDIDNALELLDKSHEMDANVLQNERHYSNTESENYIETEAEERQQESKQTSQPILPLKLQPLTLVLKACPDIKDYCLTGINNWRDLMVASAQVRGYLAISLSAYQDAIKILGQENTAVVIAYILQKINGINSAGGYLRSLTERAKVGKLSIGSMLFAALKANNTSEIRMHS